MAQSEETLWSQYEDLGLLGVGACSKVCRAHHRLTGVSVAIKVLEKAEEKFLRVTGEVDILKTTTHPNIVSLFQIVETETRIYLVLELCQTELLQHVRSNGCLQAEEARSIFCQILDAICYCHRQGIAHRDIKANNIMVDDSGKVTVIDFGMATRFLPGQMFSRCCGAYSYMSPEVIQHQAYDASKKDMWALGVLLYFMVTGTLVFRHKTVLELKKKIVRGDYKAPEFLSEELRALIRLLLTVDPELRPRAQDIKKHPWIQQGKEGSDPQEPLPRQLDNDILSLMKFMWFDLGQTVKSIQEGKFDKFMATYRLLQYEAQSRVAENVQDIPTCSGTMPLPTLTDPSAFALAPKRKQYVPTFWVLTSCSKAQEESEEGQQAEHEAFRGASCPCLHLSCQKSPTLTPSPKCLRPLTAPGTLCPSPGPPQLPEKASLPMKEERPEACARGSGVPGSSPGLLEEVIGPEVTKDKLAAPTQGTHNKGSGPELLERMTTSEEPETPNPRLRRRWKALQGRIQNCLQRFCICLPRTASRSGTT